MFSLPIDVSPVAREPLAITGVGAVCALGTGAPGAFAALVGGLSGIGAAWPGVGPVARVPGRPTGTSLARIAVREALGDVGTEGLAVVGASTAGDMVLGEHAFGQHQRGEPVERPSDFLWTWLCHRPTRIIADELEATGPVLTASTACTSGASAVAIAADLVRSGRARAAIAFGTDALCGLTTSGFAALGLHSARGCSPFDDARDGMCLGEGAGALLIERADGPRRPLALLLGAASSADAHHLSTPDPTGRGAARAIHGALAAAGISASDVDYVNAHGTGTRLNDAMEAGALAVFPRAAVSSTKGATGHTLGAAGAIEAVFTALALRDGVVPPNVGLHRSAFPLDLVTEARASAPRVALSVNFAFGGHNTALVLGRA